MSQTSRICPAPEVLVRYVHEGPSDGDCVGPHLDECPLCRNEVQALFARLATAEEETGKKETLPEELWQQIAKTHRPLAQTRVLVMHRLPAPAFVETDGSPVPQAQIAGLRSGTPASQESSVELDLGRETHALLTLDGAVLRVRVARHGRALANATILVSEHKSTTPLISAETDRRGRARVVLPAVEQSNTLDLTIRI